MSVPGDQRSSDDRAGEEALSRLSEEDLLAVDRACDRFEAAWKAGVRPSIEEASREVPATLRDAVVRELVAIEIQRRIVAGEVVAIPDYRERFPTLEVAWLSRRSAEARTMAEIPTRSDPSGKTGESDDSYPKVVGDYEILERLGSGGMGAVFKGVHRHMGRVVALKALRIDRLAQPEFAKRFEREVRAAAKLNHPHVVAAFDAREEGGRLWLVTEFLAGVDLHRLVRRDGPLPVERALDFIRQAAEGLAYAHAQGIVHRDVKPGNLFLTDDGTIKVLDLGLSRIVAIDDAALHLPGDSESLTVSGIVMGTASYVAPEQARNSRDADARADVYSLGCTLYYLLSGTPPFAGETVIDTILSHVVGPPLEMPPTLPLSPDRRSKLQAIFERMTSRDPANRFESMTELAAAIDGWLGRLDAGAAPSRSPGVRRSERAKASPRRNDLRPILAAAAAAALLSGACAFGVYAWFYAGDGEAPPVVAGGGGAPARRVVNALSFDGRTGYVAFPDFAVDPGGPATLEAVVQPYGRSNGNVISWLGTDWSALYTTAAGRWGVAKRHGEESILQEDLTPGPLGRTVHLAGTWDGEVLRFYVDGEEATTQLNGFDLGDPPGGGLYVGGVERGALPPGQEQRFFSGAIVAVRLSRGATAPNSGDLDPANWTVQPDTVGLVRFDRGSGETVREEVTGVEGRIVNARWVQLPVLSAASD